MTLVEKLEKIKIVPVLVLNSLEEGMAVCTDLYNNGLRAAEITFRTSAAEDVIREASKRFPDMIIGAGTVLNVADLHRAFDAGAKFAVAPGFNPTVVKEAVKCGFDFAPGVCTPSEAEQAMELGCKFLKFFPAEAAGGTAMLKSLIAPYKHLGIRFMPTGGVKPANVESYLEIPEVAAVGGTWLNKCPVETIRAAAEIAQKYAK
ncbi:MAG: bifunctional 4-hydroxy-2-oxoglutarate aldolase/2-dehydro-3-deoxy-phosphogluconate aldolase [Victivallaceae bacterium]|nr:bifunctional 4-hydroxy-2-oxoglutarate aldolase/2-dehydro-3-deoxy-phosphogluconate aldolase [Victivallaceae bacterium]